MNTTKRVPVNLVLEEETHKGNVILNTLDHVGTMRHQLDVKRGKNVIFCTE